MIKLKMTNKMKFLFFKILVALFFISFKLQAQDSSVLTFSSFYSQVVQNHPLAKQANLLTAAAKAELLAARGAFDPVISTNYSNKQTDGNNSYTYFEPQLKVPTLIGVDLNAGMALTKAMALL